MYHRRPTSPHAPARLGLSTVFPTTTTGTHATCQSHTGIATPATNINAGIKNAQHTHNKFQRPADTYPPTCQTEPERDYGPNHGDSQVHT